LSALCAVAFGGAVPRLDGRIVGGQEADIADYPYQVSVRIYDQHICGGSIINSNTILTAGHCVYDMDHSQYSVRVGNTIHSQGQSVRVSRVVENRNYNPQTIDNDMAILKLASDVPLGTTVQAIALQSQGAEVPAGTTAWVSGWGGEYEGSPTTPSRLRAVDVSVLTNSDCSRKYGPGQISSHMMCAQTIGHDSCQGDSGGPLAANGKLIGVVSWGYGCARPEYPGVYAKVSDMYSWIISNQ